MTIGREAMTHTADKGGDDADPKVATDWQPDDHPLWDLLRPHIRERAREARRQSKERRSDGHHRT